MVRKVKNLKFYDKFSWYIPDTKGVFILLGLLLIGAIIGNLITLPLVKYIKDTATLSVIAYPIMFIPAMVYASLKSTRQSFNNQGFKLDTKVGGGKFVVYALFVIIATLCAGFCADPLNKLLPEMPEALENTLKAMTQGNVYINFICISIFAPFFEEWLCRGMVLRGLLANNKKPIVAILVSAIFFAVIHLNPWQAIPAFVFGALFGYVYYKTGSLKLTMLMHFANNTLSLVAGQTESLKDIENWMDFFPSLQFWTLFGSCALVLCMIILYFSKIKLQSSKGNMEVVPSLFSE